MLFIYLKRLIRDTSCSNGATYLRTGNVMNIAYIVPFQFVKTATFSFAR